MTEIFINYNPYKVESIIQIDGEDIGRDSKLCSFENERLQVWIDQLIDNLSEELNEDEFKIIFHGTRLDFEDLRETCNFYDEINIKLEHVEAKESKDKIAELSELIDDMDSGPFEEFKDKVIRENFNKVIDSEFEIGVIATMSSGKSTLINSLLSRELMPTQNEACTAKVSRIKNIDGHIGFKGRCLDSNKNEVIPFKQLEDEDMVRFNTDPLISYIDIEGDITNISSRNMNLVLIDTPGPNNSQDSSHREHTFSVIKDEKYKPMILYVLNGTQLGTNDDSALLSTVAEEMKVGGKQSKDRFIFVINKIDQFDPEKESIEVMIEQSREYLEKHGIQNPNIYPASAEMAKVIRLKNSGYELTKSQNRMLRDYDLFTDEPSMHLLQYTPLSNSKKEMLNKEVNLFKDEGDYYNEALYHSGIPYIEAAINEYIDKYAFTSKITALVESFRNIIEDRQMLKIIEEEISKNENSRKELYDEMKVLESIINKGEKSKEFKEKIENLKLDANEEVRPIKGKVEKMLKEVSDKFRDDKVSKVQAKSIIDKMQKDLNFLQSDIVTDLNRMVEVNLKNNVNELLKEYKQYIDGLMTIKKREGFKSNNINFISNTMITSDELIDKYKYTQEEKVGEEYIKNYDKKWFKPWTWSESEGHYRDVYEEKEYVNVNELAGSVINPFKDTLYKSILTCVEHIDKEEKEIKLFFKDEMANLDSIVLSKIKELKQMAENSKDLQDKIRSEKKNKEWLDNFAKKLDNILEI